MHAHEDLITRFYTAFQQLDGEAMAACYHPEVRFSDPVFPDLQGPRAGAMWRMLCGAASDLEITFSDVQADDESGSAHWEPIYTFGATGRKVHNVIDASFKFQDGKIIEHTDRFDLWRWTRMALGPTGIFLGWTPMVQNKIRGQAGGGLEKFIEKNGL